MFKESKSVNNKDEAGGLGDSAPLQFTVSEPYRTLDIRDRAAPNLTHYLFRYPAKFHPPIVATLLESYSLPGETVLDPFCGSGTLGVEAMRLSRHSIGIDVDPVAVAVARAKTSRLNVGHLRNSTIRVMELTNKMARSDSEYESRMFEDLDDGEFLDLARPLRSYIPEIPNILHWFRRYVIIDLAHIRRSIEESAIPRTHKNYLRVVFASIIRNCSNADPVPVSGLEVTSHMLRRDQKGRLINPFALFSRAIEKALVGAEQFRDVTSNQYQARVLQGDATEMRKLLRTSNWNIDSVITSPPYHGAVDYYRRHKLEMYWIGATKTQDDRLALMDRYIGRPAIPKRDLRLQGARLHTPLAKKWEDKIRQVSAHRANAFLHYIVSMSYFFEGLALHLNPEAPVVLVVGHSQWNGLEIPTTSLFQELAGSKFAIAEVLTYPVRNRYMSYARRNGASISKEYVLVLRKSGSRKHIHH